MRPQQRPEAGTVPVSPRPVSQLGAVPGRHPGQAHPQPGKSKSIVKVNYDLCPKHELHIDHCCRSPHCTQHIYNYTHSRELRNASVGANTPIYTSPNIFVDTILDICNSFQSNKSSEKCNYTLLFVFVVETEELYTTCGSQPPAASVNNIFIFFYCQFHNSSQAAR